MLAFFSNTCVGPNMGDYISVGMSLVRWDYTPGSPPSGAIQGTVINQNLFAADAEYGTSALVGADHLLYAYQCSRPADDGQIHYPGRVRSLHGGPCRPRCGRHPRRMDVLERHGVGRGQRIRSADGRPAQR